MDVEVIYGLAAVVTGVDDDAIAVVEAFGAGDVGCYRDEMAEKRAMAGIGLGEGNNVLAGRNEDVHRGLGMDVSEGVAQVVLMDGRRRNGAVNDLAEEAAHGETSLHGMEFMEGWRC
jgi:hypothetical protein